jgi:hypothetical protein
VIVEAVSEAGSVFLTGQIRFAPWFQFYNPRW